MNDYGVKLFIKQMFTDRDTDLNLLAMKNCVKYVTLLVRSGIRVEIIELCLRGR